MNIQAARLERASTAAATAWGSATATAYVSAATDATTTARESSTAAANMNGWTAAADAGGATTRRPARRASTAHAAAPGKAAAHGASTPPVRHDRRGVDARRERDCGSLARPPRATRFNVLAADHRDIASELTHGPLHREASPQGLALSDAQGLTSETGITVDKQEAFLRRIASHEDGRRGGTAGHGEPALPPAG